MASSSCSYISGYKNRFQNFIKHLREMGDEVSTFFVILFVHIVSTWEIYVRTFASGVGGDHTQGSS